MDTPLISHLTAADYEHIYEPAEDSFFLLDALEADLNYLDKLQPRLCLELGSGSGVIITALAKRFAHNAVCLASDINPRACVATKRTACHNGASVDSVCCHLADGIRRRTVDLLLFNPPYVVTSDEELQSPEQVGLVHSWAGGVDGRRITDILLKQLDDILSESGVLYLLLLRENKPDEIIKQLSGSSFKAVKFMERRIPGEYLYILKVTRSKVI